VVDLLLKKIFEEEEDEEETKGRGQYIQDNDIVNEQTNQQYLQCAPSNPKSNQTRYILLREEEEEEEEEEDKK
jgi:hypothetical protein